MRLWRELPKTHALSSHALVSRPRLTHPALASKVGFQCLRPLALRLSLSLCSALWPAKARRRAAALGPADRALKALRDLGAAKNRGAPEAAKAGPLISEDDVMPLVLSTTGSFLVLVLTGALPI